MCAFKRRTESVRCALVGSTGHARHTHWGESVARTQPERSESCSCTKSATVCLRAPKFALRRYSSRTDTQILPTFLHVDSTHLQVRRDVTTALHRLRDRQSRALLCHFACYNVVLGSVYEILAVGEVPPVEVTYNDNLLFRNHM